MIIHIPHVDTVCPICGRLGRVEILEPTPALPYWIFCPAEDGCGNSYRITAIAIGARYEPGADEPILSVHTETAY